MNPHRDDTEQLDTRLARLEDELAKLRQSARTRRRFTFATVGAVAFVATIGTAVAANGTCPNGLPFCFVANQPALAVEVNHNFAQVKEWIENKAGPVTTSGFTTGSGTFTSALNAGTLTTTGAGTVAGLLTGNGGLTINNGTLTANAGMTANSGLTVNGSTLNANAGLTVSGSTVFSGYQTSCFDGVNGYIFPACCRIDIRNGQTSCRVATNWQSTAFVAGASDPFAAGSADHYSLSCFQGVFNLNFPTCCRGNSAGAVSCKAALDWQLNAWGPTGTAF